MENLPRPAATIISIVILYFTVQWYQAEGSYESIITLLVNIAFCLGLGWTTYKQFSSIQDNAEPRSNREILIDTVQHNWIEGVLHDALRDAEIQVEFEGAAEKAGDAALYRDYELPIDLVLNDGSTRENLKRSADVLLKTFEHVDRKLLILGAPGSGKTVLMLQLAERLLQEARENEKKSIPMVFNLSSWAEKRESLTDWLIERLRRDYGAGKKIAIELIQSDSLIYLLDGFDEVAEAYREECLEKINAFMSPTRQIVICSRIHEYASLTEPLNTRFAVEIEELSDEQFRAELSKSIPKAETTETIIDTLTADNEVWKEVKKPLFINILINTYSDGKPFAEHNIEGNAVEKLQRLVIEPYINRQLQNQPAVDMDNALVPRYLSWCSHNLRGKEESIFYVEMLQKDWIPKGDTRILYLWLFVTTIFLFYGILLGLLPSFVIYKIINSFDLVNINFSISGTIDGLAGAFLTMLLLTIIVLTEDLTKSIKRSFLPYLCILLLFIAIILWSVDGNIQAAFSGQFITDPNITSQITFKLFGSSFIEGQYTWILGGFLVYALIYNCIRVAQSPINLEQRFSYNRFKLLSSFLLGFILIGGLAFIFSIPFLYNGMDLLPIIVIVILFASMGGVTVMGTDGVIGKSMPHVRYQINQGFYETLRLPFEIGLTFGIFYLAFFILSVISPISIFGEFEVSFFKLSLGLLLSVLIAFLYAMLVGISGSLLPVSPKIGSPGPLIHVLKHIILRLMLEHKRLAPRRFDKFLEHVIERRIMRRVGGSAIFIHRYILEYFADEWERRYASEFEE